MYSVMTSKWPSAVLLFGMNIVFAGNVSHASATSMTAAELVSAPTAQVAAEIVAPVGVGIELDIANDILSAVFLSGAANDAVSLTLPYDSKARDRLGNADDRRERKVAIAVVTSTDIYRIDLMSLAGGQLLAQPGKAAANSILFLAQFN